MFMFKIIFLIDHSGLSLSICTLHIWHINTIFNGLQSLIFLTVLVMEFWDSAAVVTRWSVCKIRKELVFKNLWNRYNYNGCIVSHLTNLALLIIQSSRSCIIISTKNSVVWIECNCLMDMSRGILQPSRKCSHQNSVPLSNETDFCTKTKNCIEIFHLHRFNITHFQLHTTFTSVMVFDCTLKSWMSVSFSLLVTACWVPSMPKKCFHFKAHFILEKKSVGTTPGI